MSGMQPYQEVTGRSVYDIRHADADPTVLFDVSHMYQAADLRMSILS